MAAPKPAPGAIQIRVEYTVEGRGVSFSVFYGDTFALQYSQADLLALVTAWDASAVSTIYPQLSSHAVGTQYVVTDLFSDTAPRVLYAGSWTGGVGSEPVPTNVAAVIKGIQLRRYRGGKSHVFVAGYPDSKRASATLWDTASLTNLSTGFDDGDAAAFALTSSHGGHYLPICVSRFSGHAERLSPVLELITERAPEFRICTKRRRLPKIS